MAYNPVQTFQQPSQGIWEWIFGSPERIQQIQQFNPQQQQALSQLLSQGLGGLQGLQQGYGQFGQMLNQQAPSFEPIAQQARTQFQQETIPSIAERFTALGGGQRSSAFQGALGGAASGLEQNLAALRSQYGLGQQQLGLQRGQLGLQGLGQQQNLLTNLLSAGLRPQFETLNRPATPGFYQQSQNQALSSLGNLLPLFL